MPSSTPLRLALHLPVSLTRRVRLPARLALPRLYAVCGSLSRIRALALTPFLSAAPAAWRKNNKADTSSFYPLMDKGWRPWRLAVRPPGSCLQCHHQGEMPGVLYGWEQGHPGLEAGPSWP